MFALIQGNEKGWGSTEIVSFLIGSAVLIVLFVIVERRQQRPMLDLTLFRRPAFAGASIVAFAISASMFAMFLYLTLYIQDVLGYSPLQAGLRFLPITLLSFVVAPISGRLSVRVPVRLLLGSGLLLVSGGPARDDRDRRELRLDHADPGLPARGRGHRDDQPAARLDRDRRRAPHAQRHGLGHQQHVPPGRHRDRHRRPGRVFQHDVTHNTTAALRRSRAGHAGPARRARQARRARSSPATCGRRPLAARRGARARSTTPTASASPMR